MPGLSIFSVLFLTPVRGAPQSQPTNPTSSCVTLALRLLSGQPKTQQLHVQVIMSEQIHTDRNTNRSDLHQTNTF